MKNALLLKEIKLDLAMHIININNQNILCLSDTHGSHRLINLPRNIQIVIHCGDICNAGNRNEITDFFKWYTHLAIPHKIFIHGNHDLPFELEPVQSKKLIPKNVLWLNDEAAVINGISIRGISAFPFYEPIKTKNKIDIIASHYPPFGILDDGVGSEEINNFIFTHSPKYHVFGHNHSGYGKINYENIQYINASIYHTLCQEENQ